MLEVICYMTLELNFLHNQDLRESYIPSVIKQVAE